MSVCNCLLSISLCPVQKVKNSNATCLSRLVLQNFEELKELYSGAFLLLLFIPTIHLYLLRSYSSNRAFYSELPENICGFHDAPGALGIQLSEVCSLHWDRLETA